MDRRRSVTLPRWPFMETQIITAAVVTTALCAVVWYMVVGPFAFSPIDATSSHFNLYTPSRQERRAITARICKNTCPFANDGVCQEGRPTVSGAGFANHQLQTKDDQQDGQRYTAVKCDLGTDCNDCGAWNYSGPIEGLGWTPISDLVAQGIQVNVRRTDTPVPFWMPYTDPAIDLDVSKDMESSALVEPGLSWVWYKILKQGCTPSNTHRTGLVLDVGANFGYYSLMAASMGCNVVAWEPVPNYASFFKYALIRNHFLSKVQLRQRIVDDKGRGLKSITVPGSGHLRTAGVGGQTIPHAEYHNVTKLKAISEKIDQVVKPQNILIMKIDVQGLESAVLKGSKVLLLDGNVQNIMMEYSPGVAEAQADWKAAESNPASLLGLTLDGYKILHVPEAFRLAKDSTDWADELPSMPYVHETSLRHDAEDAKRLQQGTLGCPLPPSLLLKGGVLWDCPGTFEMERLSPKGFRPTFGYSTKVWASRSAISPGIYGGFASLIPPTDEYDVNQWFIPGNITYSRWLGDGVRQCSDIDPMDQVKSRCHCTSYGWCGLLEAEIMIAEQHDRLPPVPLPDAVWATDYQISEW